MLCILGYINDTMHGYGTFRNRSSFVNIDLSGWNTASCESAYNMFYGCSSLKTIIYGDGWNTSNVTTFSRMFLYFIDFGIQTKKIHYPDQTNSLFPTVKTKELYHKLTEFFFHMKNQSY